MSKKVVIIGQGYVGLPLAQGMARSGLQVTGLDTNQKVVDNLNNGISHIDDLSNQEIAEMVEKAYRASTDPKVIAEADAVIICVPTPLNENEEPDLRAVQAATRTVAENLNPAQQTLVVLESTTYPGTTHELLLPAIEKTGKTLDKDFFLAFSPERIDPGNPTYGLKNTPKVVGGVSPESTKQAADFYAQFVDTVVPVKSAREAETAKLLENTYRHINIALVNEMVRFCHELDIDLWEVIRAASTKPFGFQAFYPGPGVGGHCIPIDPNYLSYEVERRLGYPFRFVELAQEINNGMPSYVVERARDLLNDSSKAVKGSKVLLLGVSYKPNIADERESPAKPIAEILLSLGAELSYHDPRVANWKISGTEFESVANLEAAVEESDLVILLQGHREYDLNRLAELSRLFFDTSGKTSSSKAVRL